VLVGTNLCRAVLLGSLPAWDDALPADLALYGALLALLAFGRLFLTTKAAVLPVLLGETHLLQGNAISGGAGMIAALVGGVLGLGAAAALGPALVFALSGALYFASAIAAYRLGRLAPARVASDEPLGEAFGRIALELRRGLLEVWERRRARVALGAIFVLRSAVMLTALAAVLIIKNEYPGAGDRVGRLSAGALALGTSSLGAFAGALFVSWFGRRFGSARLILQGFVVAGAGIVALGGIPDLRAVLILTAIAGYGAYVAKIAADAQVQEALADAYRGRAFALYDVLYNLASVTAAAVIVAFQEINFRALFVPAGGATLALTALVWAAMRRADMLGSRAP
jgi:hypothetical protein